MIKNIHSLIILLIFFPLASGAQGTNMPVKNGFYQKLDLGEDTPCNCNDKTDRTYQLNKGLAPKEVTQYKLHAYKFTFKTTGTRGVSKLFKAFEKDSSVYKTSVNEWTSFMLLTTDDFDQASFEQAAASVFATFAPIAPEAFLKDKNNDTYTEYMEMLKLEQLKKEYNSSNDAQTPK